MRSTKGIKYYLSAYHSEVTGSRFLLRIEYPDGNVERVMVDCGLFQELKYRHLNYVNDIDYSTIDAMVITHNHIDHTGLAPKAVHQGYTGKIYMTEITQVLIEDYWQDCLKQQPDNIKEMKKRFPAEAEKFKQLYFSEDVNRAVSLCHGVRYRKTIQILPRVKLTLFENCHILGASMPLLQVSYPGIKKLSFLFTGDYNVRNPFFEAPELPDWLLEEELVIVCESTYGTMHNEDISVCFEKNIIEAITKKQNILVGAFAQGRMQSVLFDLKKMQDNGLIPSEYQIVVDGPLGIRTCKKYEDILKWYNPPMSDFIPKGVTWRWSGAKSSILKDENPKIVITTSGMLSRGPAREYVPIFLEDSNAFIHIIGYAAEETLARKLLDGMDDEKLEIGQRIYQKKATVKVTNEKSAHATSDQIIEFLKQFKNVQAVLVNHGEIDVQVAFCERVNAECRNVRMADLINRSTMYCIIQNSKDNAIYEDIRIKKMPTKISESSTQFGVQGDFHKKLPWLHKRYRNR